MINVYFGMPGSGKTTNIARTVIKLLSNKNGMQYDYIYCNIPLAINDNRLRPLKLEWLGTKNLYNSLIIMDEGSLLFDSRDYKNFGKDKLHFFLMHRHYKLDIDIYVQQWNALDLKIRNITDNVYWISKSRIPNFSIISPVPYLLYFADDGAAKEKVGDIKMGYQSPAKLSGRYFCRKKYYKYFDSYSTAGLPDITDEDIEEGLLTVYGRKIEREVTSWKSIPTE